MALLCRQRIGDFGTDVTGHPIKGAKAVRPPVARDLVPCPVPLPVLQVLLITAGLACCVTMAMPQVHMIAYCIDLGHGAARGAELLSIMLILGVVSRLISGVVADKIGGLATLLILGSRRQYSKQHPKPVTAKLVLQLQTLFRQAPRRQHLRWK